MFVKNHQHLFTTNGYHFYETINRNKFEKVMHRTTTFEKKSPYYLVSISQKEFRNISQSYQPNPLKSNSFVIYQTNAIPATLALQILNSNYKKKNKNYCLRRWSDSVIILYVPFSGYILNS